MGDNPVYILGYWRIILTASENILNSGCESFLGPIFPHLPVKEAFYHRPSPRKRLDIDSPLPRGVERILIVDDEPAIVTINRNVLERLGYKVTATFGSREALDLIRKNPHGVDLVITDQTMPDLTGADGFFNQESFPRCPDGYSPISNLGGMPPTTGS